VRPGCPEPRARAVLYPQGQPLTGRGALRAIGRPVRAFLKLEGRVNRSETLSLEPSSQVRAIRPRDPASLLLPKSFDSRTVFRYRSRCEVPLIGFAVPEGTVWWPPAKLAVNPVVTLGERHDPRHRAVRREGGADCRNYPECFLV